MATSRSTWKARERSAARFFGAERQVGSGSGGRADQTRSDSTSEKLFIETKLRASSATRNLWEKTAAFAKLEGKTPVLMLYSKGKRGALAVIHESDLRAVLDELVAKQQADAERAAEEAFS